MKTTKSIVLLEKAIRFDRNRSLVWGLLLLPLGLFLFQFASFENIAGIVLPATGFALVLIALKLFFEVFVNWTPAKHPIIHVIQKNKGQIVWIYSVVTEVSPFGIKLFKTGELFFKMDDRTEISFSFPTEQLSKLSKSLNSLLPHTTFGYTEERDQWYEVDPLLLRK